MRINGIIGIILGCCVYILPAYGETFEEMDIDIVSPHELFIPVIERDFIVKVDLRKNKIPEIEGKPDLSRITIEIKSDNKVEADFSPKTESIKYDKDLGQLKFRVTILPKTVPGDKYIEISFVGSDLKKYLGRQAFSFRPGTNEFIFLQNNKKVRTSLMPEEPVILKSAYEVSLTGKADLDEGFSQRISRITPFMYQDGSYYYNLGGFRPEDELTISIVNSKGDKKEPIYYVPQQRFTVKPGPYSIRYGKAIVEHDAPQFVGLFVRLYRHEYNSLLPAWPFRSLHDYFSLDTTAVMSFGFGVGMSVDSEKKHYIGGVSVEFFDVIDVSMGCAVQSGKSIKDICIDHPYVGASFDLRLIKALIKGASELVSLK